MTSPKQAAALTAMLLIPTAVAVTYAWRQRHCATSCASHGWPGSDIDDGRCVCVRQVPDPRGPDPRRWKEYEPR